MDNEWFRKTIEETTRALGTDTGHGLSTETAASRLRERGPNELAEAEKQ